MMVQILGLDVAGNPSTWLGREAAATLAVTGRIAWQWGEPAIVLRGGRNRHGERSILAISAIVGLDGRRPVVDFRSELPLTNELLFRRDGRLCAYCGQQFRTRELSRDHVVPRVQGGADRWTNVVTVPATSARVGDGRRRHGTCGCSTYLMPRAAGSTSSCRRETSWPTRWSSWQPGCRGIAGRSIGSPSEPAKSNDVFQ